MRLVASVAWGILVALLSLPPNVSAQTSGATRVEGIAAVIGSTAAGTGADIVLRSDVELRAKLALRARGAGEGGEPIPDALLAATLREIVGEFLIAREAERLRLGSPDDRAVARERARIVESVGGEAALAVLLDAERASGDEIDAIARRRAVVQDFLQANLEGATEIGEAELERGYARGGHPFVDQPFETVREPLRAWLAQRAIERAVLRWIMVLEARTPMRVMAEYGEARRTPGVPR